MDVKALSGSEEWSAAPPDTTMCASETLESLEVIIKPIARLQATDKRIHLLFNMRSSVLGLIVLHRFSRTKPVAENVGFRVPGESQQRDAVFAYRY